MDVQTEEDLIGLQKIGRIVANCLQYMSKQLEPGMTTFELDNLGKKFLEKHGAKSAPKMVYNFPGTTCISVNHEAAHGLPSRDKVLAAGDLVNIDVSAELGGYFGDTGGSFIIPPETPVKRKVCDVAMTAMWAGINAASHNVKLNEIGRAIESEAKKHGLTVIRDLCSHGVGRWLHEEPDAIPGYYDKSDRRMLREGMVITIEPFISNGAKHIEDTDDGWTLVTPKHFTAQYEHTIVLTKDKALIMTTPDGKY